MARRVSPQTYTPRIGERVVYAFRGGRVLGTLVSVRWDKLGVCEIQCPTGELVRVELCAGAELLVDSGPAIHEALYVDDLLAEALEVRATWNRACNAMDDMNGRDAAGEPVPPSERALAWGLEAAVHKDWHPEYALKCLEYAARWSEHAKENQ